jgi:predicted nuclease of predicted toxin-antitoxin system
MARLFADENFPIAVTVALRALGHDVLTAHEAGRANQGIPDDEVLAWATTQGRAVVTLNRRDFHRLHAASPNHAGIITCTRDDANPVPPAARIHAAVNAAASLAGALLRVVRPGSAP